MSTPIANPLDATLGAHMSKSTRKPTRKNVWYQIGGDMNPATYGATLAQWDGYAVNVLRIDPVLEYVGERDGVAVGYPFWASEACYDADDFATFLADKRALESCCIDAEDFAGRLTIAQRFDLADQMIGYGYRMAPCPSGFSRDVLPARRVVWWHSSAREWRAADVEYRALVRAQ